jgi:3-methyladenine DNA glycosylase AlkD
MKLLAAIRAALKAAGHPERAKAMRAYMKSAMPYAGVGMPEARRIFRDIFATYPDGEPSRKPFEHEEAFFADVRTLWDGAKVREERYAAIELFTCARAKKVRTLRALPLLEHIVVTGAWWDLVDWVAPKTFEPLLDTDPEGVAPVIRKWARSENVWLRRSAILSQLHKKAKTDTTLLEDVLAPSLDSKEFFIAKAIGWALRQYARTDAAFVRAYLEKHRTKMAKLSIREAEKHL